MSMRQFQIARAVHFLKSGLREDGSDPEKMTLQDVAKLENEIEEAQNVDGQVSR